MLYSTLCYLEQGDQYLMLHRVKKAHDVNQGKWIGVGGKFLDTASAWTGVPHGCDEGELAWIKKDQLRSLPLWEGDKIFLGLLETEEPFFSLKLRYEGDRLVQAVLNGKVLDQE